MREVDITKYLPNKLPLKNIIDIKSNEKAHPKVDHQIQIRVEKCLKHMK